MTLVLYTTDKAFFLDLASIRQGSSWEDRAPCSWGSWSVLYITLQGAFLHIRVVWGNSFPIAQHTRMKSEVSQGCAEHMHIPQKDANKNLFRLPHRNCSPQSTSLQGDPDPQKSPTHNGDKVSYDLLYSEVRRWKEPWIPYHTSVKSLCLALRWPWKLLITLNF